ncbi:MAG: TetR/AcrR family transcriptional regulator [Streptosporangiaceae bacterium]
MASNAVGVLAPERRQMLLETAAREFASAGYERASLNKIISACRMSKSSFYHYFDSRAALFDTVVDEAAEALGRELAIPDPRHLAGPDFWDRIAALFRDLLAVSEQREWYVDFGKLFYLPDAPVERSRALRQAVAAMTAWLEEALAAGRAFGAVRDDLPSSLQVDLTLAVLRSMDSWSLRHMHEIAPDEREALAASQLDILRRLLGP